MLTDQIIQPIEIANNKSLHKTSSSKSKTTKTKSFKNLLEKLKISKTKSKAKEKMGNMPEDLAHILAQLINLKSPEEDLVAFISEELEGDSIPELFLNATFPNIDIETESLVEYRDSIFFLREFFAELEAKDIPNEVLEEFTQYLQENFPKAKFDTETIKQQISKNLKDQDLSKPHITNLKEEEFLQLDIKSKPYKNSEKVENEVKNLEEINIEYEKTSSKNDGGKPLKQQKLKVQKSKGPLEFKTIQNKLIKKPGKPLIIENETENINLDHINTYTVSQNIGIAKEPIEVTVEIPQDVPIDFDKVFDKIVQKIDTVINENTEVIKIRLKPDFLGEVLIKIVSEKGQLKTQLFIENAKVRKAFYLNAPKLENQIQKQGYNTVKVDIYDMTKGGYMDYQSQQNRQNQDFTRPKRHFYQNFREKDVKKDIDLYDSWYDVSNVNYMA